MKIYPIFAWYDLWIGLFIDAKKKRLYIFPIPCFGLVIEWNEEEVDRSGCCPSCRDPGLVGVCAGCGRRGENR
jgi:hypothetical protein